MQRAEYERLEPTPQLSWKGFAVPGPFVYHWHYHPEIELTVFTNGRGTRFVGDSVAPMGAGDAVLIGPSLAHTFVSDRSGEAICAQFSQEVLAGWIALPEFAAVQRLLRRAARGLTFKVDDPAQYRVLVDAAPAERTVELLRRLVGLAARDDLGFITTSDYEPHLAAAAQQRLEAIMQHLAENLSKPVALAEIAGVAYLSPAATSRFFRRVTGQTLTDYVSKIRIAAACRMLSDPRRSGGLISAVAQECGFTNLSNFNRTFRRLMAVTPGEFRRQSR